MEFQVYTSLKGTRGRDTEANLTLTITGNSDHPPKFLSDFAGGGEKIYDGYSTRTSKFVTAPANDPRRLSLTFENGSHATLHPCFERIQNPEDPLNQLRALPLAIGQMLALSYSDTPNSQDFEIIGFNWK
ncbi:hypothetical protein [Pseudomonas petroselini]|uniref:hypothetical protein n=1 Tax=Pseudomonas petroselini TaxID=2899822 RepID=UPI0038635113